PPTQTSTLSLHDALPIFERPHLHLAEALPAELGLAAQRLLGDERVWAGAARVDLVVHEVQQLQDVHVADGDLLLVGLTGAAVVEDRKSTRLNSSHSQISY